MENDTGATDSPRTAAPELAPVAGSARRRLGLSVFVVVTLAAIAMSVMPASLLRDRLLPVAQPYLLATGLDQGWGVFSPNPPQESTTVRARVERADGTSADYAPPHGRDLAAYWDYRWLKLGDRVLEETDGTTLRAAFAWWAVGEDRRAGNRPVHVTLLRTTVPNLAPGDGSDSGEPREEPIYQQTVVSR